MDLFLKIVYSLMKYNEYKAKRRAEEKKSKLFTNEAHQDNKESE